MKSYLLVVVLLLVSSLSTLASAAHYPNYPSRYPTPYTDTLAPATIVKTGISKLTSFIRSGAAKDPVKAQTFLETEVEPYFDFNYMARWAAGPAWRGMSPAQRKQLQERITQSFMTTLAQKLTSYSNQPIRYFTPRGQGGNDVRVSAWIMQPNGIPTKLEFRFYKTEDGWKIFDVKAAGNSAVIYYRNQFRKLYRTGY